MLGSDLGTVINNLPSFLLKYFWLFIWAFLYKWINFLNAFGKIENFITKIFVIN